MYGSGPKPTGKKNKTVGIKSLLRELSDDEDEDIPTIPLYLMILRNLIGESSVATLMLSMRYQRE
jgi:hypothetical protein